MEEYKETVRRDEPGDLETLNFVPSWHSGIATYQSMAIAPLKNNRVSIITYKQHKDEHTNYIHFILTEKEVDMLISALIEAKVRWKTGEVIK